MRYSELAMSVQLHVEIPFHPDHRRQGVDVEELDGFGDSVFDEHALRIAGWSPVPPRRVGDSWSITRLAPRIGIPSPSTAAVPPVAGEGHVFLQHFGVAIDARQRREADTPPESG